MGCACCYDGDGNELWTTSQAADHYTGWDLAYLHQIFQRMFFAI